MKVKNSYGTEIDYELAVHFMDDEIREKLHNELAPCTEQHFFTAYATAHKETFDEEWELDKYNPTV